MKFLLPLFLCVIISAVCVDIALAAALPSTDPVSGLAWYKKLGDNLPFSRWKEKLRQWLNDRFVLRDQRPSSYKNFPKTLVYSFSPEGSQTTQNVDSAHSNVAIAVTGDTADNTAPEDRAVTTHVIENDKIISKFKTIPFTEPRKKLSVDDSTDFRKIAYYEFSPLTSKKGLPIVLYFHGAHENIRDQQTKYHQLANSLETKVVAMEYPGFGVMNDELGWRSGGRDRRADLILIAAQRLSKHLLSKSTYQFIVLFGNGWGGKIAMRLVQTFDEWWKGNKLIRFSGMVLKNPIVPALVKRKSPVFGWLRSFISKSIVNIQVFRPPPNFPVFIWSTKSSTEKERMELVNLKRKWNAQLLFGYGPNYIGNFLQTAASKTENSARKEEESLSARLSQGKFGTDSQVVDMSDISSPVYELMSRPLILSHPISSNSLNDLSTIAPDTRRNSIEDVPELASTALIGRHDRFGDNFVPSPFKAGNVWVNLPKIPPAVEKKDEHMARQYQGLGLEQLLNKDVIPVQRVAEWEDLLSAVESYIQPAEDISLSREEENDPAKNLDKAPFQVPRRVNSNSELTKMLASEAQQQTPEFETMQSLKSIRLSPSRIPRPPLSRANVAATTSDDLVFTPFSSAQTLPFQTGESPKLFLFPNRQKSAASTKSTATEYHAASSDIFGQSYSGDNWESDFPELFGSMQASSSDIQEAIAGLRRKQDTNDQFVSASHGILEGDTISSQESFSKLLTKQLPMSPQGSAVGFEDKKFNSISPASVDGGALKEQAESFDDKIEEIVPFEEDFVDAVEDKDPEDLEIFEDIPQDLRADPTPEPVLGEQPSAVDEDLPAGKLDEDLEDKDEIAYSPMDRGFVAPRPAASDSAPGPVYFRGPYTLQSHPLNPKFPTLVPGPGQEVMERDFRIPVLRQRAPSTSMPIRYSNHDLANLPTRRFYSHSAIEGNDLEGHQSKGLLQSVLSRLPSPKNIFNFVTGHQQKEDLIKYD